MELGCASGEQMQAYHYFANVPSILAGVNPLRISVHNALYLKKKLSVLDYW